jgi:multidrug resistance efflux pump
VVKVAADVADLLNGIAGSIDNGEVEKGDLAQSLEQASERARLAESEVVTLRNKNNMQRMDIEHFRKRAEAMEAERDAIAATLHEVLNHGGHTHEAPALTSEVEEVAEAAPLSMSISTPMEPEAPAPKVARSRTKKV